MKKLVFFFSIIFALSFLFASCQEDELPNILPGIIYTDNPPEELFGDDVYASTNKCWLDKSSFLLAKSLGWNSNSFYDEEDGWIYYDSGEWYAVPASDYFGIKDGIIYLSKSVKWHIISPKNFL